MIQVPETPQADVPSPISQVVPFAAGAGNQLLFGLPEAALKGIGGDKVKQIVDTYKALNPGYGAGETVGGVGSMLIPGGAISKGLGEGAKAVGATKVGETLGKLGDVAAGKMGVGQGLMTAGEQAIPRAVAGGLEGDKNTGADLGESLAIGGALGGAGKLIGAGAKVLGNTGIGKTIKDEASKTLQDAILSGADVNTGALMKQMNDTSRRLGIDKVGNLFNNVEDLKNRTAQFIVDNNLGNKVAREAFLSDQSPLWQKVANDYNAQPVDFADSGVIDAIKADPNVQEYVKRSGVGEQAVDNLILDQASDLSQRPDYNQAKSYLTDQSRLGNKAGTELGDAQKAIADTMHDMIDSHAMSLSPELAQLKADYPIIKLLKRASGKEQAIVENPIKEGSDTFQKLATNAALGGAVGGAAAPDQEKVGGAITGALAAPLLSRTLGKVGTQALAGIASGAIKLGQNPELLKAVNPLRIGEKGGNLLEPMRNNPDTGATLGAPSQLSLGGQAIPAGGPVPTLQPQAFTPPSNPLDKSLELAWQLEDPRGNIESQAPGTKQAFIEDVKKQLTNPDGSINYARAATALFPDKPEDAKAFKESYIALQRIQSGLPNAVKLITINDPRAEADKQAVVDSVSEVLKRGQGMKEEEAQKRVKGILESPIRTPAQKGALLMNLLKTADPYSFGEGGLLERAGVFQ